MKESSSSNGNSSFEDLVAGPSLSGIQDYQSKPHLMKKWQTFVGTLTEDSRKLYEAVVEDFNEWFSSLGIRRLDEDLLIEYVNHKENLAPNTFLLPQCFSQYCETSQSVF